MKQYQIIVALCILGLTGCPKANQTKSVEQLTREHEEKKAREEHFENIKAIMEGDGQALIREVK